jgi:hypothetical protein
MRLNKLSLGLCGLAFILGGCLRVPEKQYPIDTLGDTSSEIHNVEWGSPKYPFNDLGQPINNVLVCYEKTEFLNDACGKEAERCVGTLDFYLEGITQQHNGVNNDDVSFWTNIGEPNHRPNGKQVLLSPMYTDDEKVCYNFEVPYLESEAESMVVDVNPLNENGSFNFGFPSAAGALLRPIEAKINGEDVDIGVKYSDFFNDFDFWVGADIVADISGSFLHGYGLDTNACPHTVEETLRPSVVRTCTDQVLVYTDIYYQGEGILEDVTIDSTIDLTEDCEVVAVDNRHRLECEVDVIVEDADLIKTVRFEEDSAIDDLFTRD